MSLEKHAKNKIDVIKNSIKVIEGDLKRLDESHDLKRSYDKVEEEQRDLVSHNVDLVKMINTLEKDVNHKFKVLY